MTATAVVGKMVMEEIKPPELIKLTEKGAFVGGRLRSINVERIMDDDTKREKDVTVYLIEKDNGDLVKLRTSADLQQKITPKLVGRYVVITYEGLDQSVGLDKGNAMKRFKVLAEKRGTASDSTEITDEDVGF